MDLLLNALFGLFTVKNIQRRWIQYFISSQPPRNGTRAQRNSTVSYRSDRQFICLLLTEILIWMIFDFIHLSVFLYKQRVANWWRSSDSVFTSLTICWLYKGIFFRFNKLINERWRYKVKYLHQRYDSSPGNRSIQC
jgi:hypothetical protein